MVSNGFIMFKTGGPSARQFITVNKLFRKYGGKNWTNMGVEFV